MKGHIKKDYKKRAQHRLKIIQGQVTGLEKMVEDEAYCIDVLHQSLAIQESLKSFDGLMLENHLKTHGVSHFTGKNKEKGIQEMLKLYKLRNK
jgi:CsoR family transcriptional regulator, copper-sensing transcriptional repressor